MPIITEPVVRAGTEHDAAENAAACRAAYYVATALPVIEAHPVRDGACHG